MTDPRSELRATLARWLRLRAHARGLRAALVAAEAVHARDARRSDDPAMATLGEQLALQRRALEALEAGLDSRIGEVKAGCDALEARYVEQVVGAASVSRLPSERGRSADPLSQT